MPFGRSQPSLNRRDSNSRQEAVAEFITSCYYYELIYPILMSGVCKFKVQN